MSDGVSGPGAASSQPVFVPPTFQTGVDETTAQTIAKKGGAGSASRTGNEAFGSTIESGSASGAVNATQSWSAGASVYDSYTDLPAIEQPVSVPIGTLRASGSWIGSPYAIALMGILFMIQITMEEMETSNLGLVLNTMEAEWDAAKTEAELTRKNADMKFQQAIMQCVGHAVQAATSIGGLVGSAYGSFKANKKVTNDIEEARLNTPEGARQNAVEKRDAYEAQLALPKGEQKPKALRKAKEEYEAALDKHYKVNGYNVGQKNDADGHPIPADELAVRDPRTQENTVLQFQQNRSADIDSAGLRGAYENPNNAGGKKQIDDKAKEFPGNTPKDNEIAEKAYVNLASSKNQMITQETNTNIQKYSSVGMMGQSFSGIMQTAAEIVWGKEIGYNEALMKELSSIREQYRQLTQSLMGDQRSMHDLYAELQNMVKQALNELNNTAKMQ
jgi:hypothetical protein